MLEKTLGIVLHTVAYNDKNHIAHLYTEKYGRMSYAIPQTQGRKADYTPRLREILSLHEKGRVLSPLGMAYLLEG